MTNAAQPNILWIIADQLRADHVGFGGNPVVRTPSLDALAARACVFDRAYVANPICMPNRCPSRPISPAGQASAGWAQLTLSLTT